MSGRYLIRIEAWPYSLEEGGEVAQALAGPRVQAFIVPADDIRAALAKAEIFRDGMLTNPHVWQAPITEVRLANHGEEARFERPCVTSVPKARRASPAPVNPPAKD
ncbi:hypothetical protein MEX01_28970 [Methylorubrum extorquens]|uniref:hypothetical protein n=1 Tax=Methylorubrum extorquens TaxID=408 RepID=UPI00116E527C|nr:hypothetical protein [Methylorubrum extorquens]GEL42306.1 hypothetical protein MEX01_28970 [Methylorubrum extorquens]